MISRLKGWSCQARAGFLPTDLFPDERLVLLDDPAHLVLDRGQVVLSDRRRKIEVVVQAVLDRWSDRVLRAREKAADRLRQHVGGGVAKDVEPVGGRRLDRLDGRVGGFLCIWDVREVAEHAVDARRDRVRWQHGADRLPLGELDVGTVRQGQSRHGRHDIGGVRALRRALLVGDRFQDLDPRGSDRRCDRRHEPEQRGDHRERDQEAPRDRQA